MWGLNSSMQPAPVLTLRCAVLECSRRPSHGRGWAMSGTACPEKWETTGIRQPSRRQVRHGKLIALHDKQQPCSKKTCAEPGRFRTSRSTASRLNPECSTTSRRRSLLRRRQTTSSRLETTSPDGRGNRSVLIPPKRQAARLLGALARPDGAIVSLLRSLMRPTSGSSICPRARLSVSSRRRISSSAIADV